MRPETAMHKFTFSYPAKVYLGEGIAADALRQELPKVGKTVMLAYGSGSLNWNTSSALIQTAIKASPSSAG